MATPSGSSSARPLLDDRGSDQCLAIGLIRQHVEPVVGGQPRGFDVEVGPGRGLGFAEVDPLEDAGAQQREVALGVRWHRPDPVPPEIESERVDPLRLHPSEVLLGEEAVADLGERGAEGARTSRTFLRRRSCAARRQPRDGPVCRRPGCRGRPRRRPPRRPPRPTWRGGGGPRSRPLPGRLRVPARRRSGACRAWREGRASRRRSRGPGCYGCHRGTAWPCGLRPGAPRDPLPNRLCRTSSGSRGWRRRGGRARRGRRRARTCAGS